MVYQDFGWSLMAWFLSYRSRIFRLSILGFEGYRFGISVTLRWSTENRFGAKSKVAANRSWPRGHSGPRQTAATFKSVHFHFLFQLLELIIIDGWDLFHISSSRIEIVIFYQNQIASNISSSFENFRKF